jgi:hypothetical protein
MKGLRCWNRHLTNLPLEDTKNKGTIQKSIPENFQALQEDINPERANDHLVLNKNIKVNKIPEIVYWKYYSDKERKKLPRL